MVYGWCMVLKVFLFPGSAIFYRVIKRFALFEKNESSGKVVEFLKHLNGRSR